MSKVSDNLLKHIVYKIGNYNSETGEITRGWFRQGYVFKDYEAFYDRLNDDVCYVPELTDETYTRNKIIKLCKGNIELATEVFDSLDWQSPETEIDELLRDEYINYNAKTDTYERIW